MITITSNIAEVAAAFKGLFDDLSRYPRMREASLRGIIAEGVGSHFDKLGQGSSDPSALGGGVHWLRARGELTKQVRGKGNLYPLLQHTGAMKRAFTTGSSIKHAKAGGFSIANYSTSSATALDKGATNQFGQRGGSGRSAALSFNEMNIPARPFLYWDQRMAAATRGDLISHFVQTKNKWRVA